MQTAQSILYAEKKQLIPYRIMVNVEYMNVQNVKLLMCLWIDDVCWYNSNETNNALSQERQLPFHNFVYELEILFIVFCLARSNAMAPLNAH